jgi:hypothetical protein
MAFYEIQLDPEVNSVFTTILNGNQLNMRVRWVEAVDGGWFLDIADSSNAALVLGIPMVPGQNLMRPYGYLGLGFRLWVIVDGGTARDPGWSDWGSSARLFAEY